LNEQFKIRINLLRLFNGIDETIPNKLHFFTMQRVCTFYLTGLLNTFAVVTGVNFCNTLLEDTKNENTWEDVKNKCLERGLPTAKDSIVKAGYYASLWPATVTIFGWRTYKV
jgi:hypothetical protein